MFLLAVLLTLASAPAWAHAAHQGPKTPFDEGYILQDAPGTSEPPSTLRRFRLKIDFDRIPTETAFPWQRISFDPNQPSRGQALALAYVLQAYVYEGMVSHADDNETNFDPWASARYWCQMPWLDRLPYGREWVHGLTDERSLEPSSAIYPQAADYRSAATFGKDWGAGYFNSVACRTLKAVFTGKGSGIAPDFGKADFAENSLAFKLLWTTADFAGIEGFSGIEQAPAWWAHVGVAGDDSRSVRKVRHIQMDVLLKSSFGGASSALASHWMMVGYVFDERFDNRAGLRASGFRGKLAPGYEHIKPLGLQFGLEKEQTLLFFDARNGDPEIDRLPGVTNQQSGLLAGPADNGRSSCVACHSTAGTNRDRILGFESNEAYNLYRRKVRTLDFSLLLALAKRNFETFAMNVEEKRR